MFYKGFVGFPHLYPLETKTLWNARVSTPDTGQIPIVKKCTQA